MKGLFLVLLLWLAPAAEAQTVQVTSGEHEGFSRLVLTFPQAVAWRVFRSAGGYGLGVRDEKLRFNLTEVFRFIPRSRLKSIFVDPDTGILQLGIGCACHILPFDLRPGVVVLDIRDGPAPVGSSFELAQDGRQMPALSAVALPRPQKRPAADARPETSSLPPFLHWRSDLATAARMPTVDPLMSLPSFSGIGTEARAELRNALLWQVGRGFAEGVVEIDKNLPPPTHDPFRPTTMPESHLRLVPAPGMDAAVRRHASDQLTADGVKCIGDDRLDLSAWGGAGGMAEQVGAVRSALIGEFDIPEKTNVATAVRFYLHFGFGTEAKHLLRAMEDASPDRALWESIADIVDENLPTSSAFSGMEVCDGLVALWAVLSKPQLPPGGKLKVSAVLRSFSALPLHLRRQLGPSLANRFLDRGDVATARAIENAILRSAGEAGAPVRLMTAEIDLAHDPSPQARHALDPLTAETGPVGIEATVALILSQAQSGEVVSAAHTMAAAAYLHEAKGGPREQPLRDALSIGLAIQDRYDKALALSPLSDMARAAVFFRLASNGPDSDIVLHAILPADKAAPVLPQTTRRLLAARLIRLGFGQPALRWLDGAEASANDADRLIVAQAQLLQHDGRAALKSLSGLQGEAAEGLRANALSQLNDPAAMESYGKIGALQQQEKIARRLLDWPKVMVLSAESTWGAAASLIPARPEPPVLTVSQPGSQEPSGPYVSAGQTADSERRPQSELPELPPLARARAALDDSAAARSVLVELLSASALPPVQN